MITEDYCSFEVAKLLKEKGFDGECETSYYISNKGCENSVSVGDFTKVKPWREALIAAPTHQMAMKWLREVYNRYIEICTDKGHNFVDIVFRPAVYDGDLVCLYESDNFSSYEQAVEAALKYSLENLI